MLKNYLLVTLRNMRKHKTYSVINLAGLVIGLTSCVLILLFVRYEQSYDRFHKNADDIYRVLRKEPGANTQGSNLYNLNPAPLKKALTDEFPEIIRSARIISLWRPSIKDRNGLRSESRVFLADPEFLEMFTFPLAAGDPRTALNDPFSVLLTEDAARKYFGRENPVGRTVSIDDKYDFKITGVLKNLPKNSHISFDFLASFQSWPAMNPRFADFWYWYYTQTYIQLAPETPPAGLSAKLPSFSKAKMANSPMWKTTEFLIQPLTDIHLRGQANFEIEANGDIRYIRLLEAVGALIMLIACLNYMNLATARASQRAKEIGIRKVVGAVRAHLIPQLLGESVIFTLLALGCSVVIAHQLLPAFRVFTGREIPFGLLGQTGTLGILAAVTIVVGLLSGSYPAFFLSSLHPVRILKGKLLLRSRKNLGLRQSLVVSQFVISIALAACTLIVSSQLRLIRTKNLGFTTEHIVTVDLEDGTLQKNPEPFRFALSRLAGVSDVAFSSTLPDSNVNWIFAYWEGKTDPGHFLISQNFIDENYLRMSGIKLAQGRNFSRQIATDAKTAYILNQAAVRAIGWTDPVGKNFYVDGADKRGVVIGVVENFNFQSLHKDIGPLAIQFDMEPRYASIKIRAGRTSETIAAVENIFKTFSPAYPFSYRFLDERINALYRSERKMAGSLNGLTIIALFVAGLGLFGLASFTTDQRMKEIGIRKVLGSTEAGIVRLLNMEYARWIIAAGFIAWPIAYFAIQTWMRSFAYRAPITVGVFLGAEAVALLLAAATVSLQAIKASRVDPVVILKHE